MNIYGFSGPAPVGQTLDELMAAQMSSFAASLDQSSPPAVEESTSLPSSPVWEAYPGYTRSRASGMLAVLLVANRVTLSDVNEWYTQNGLIGHTPSLSPSDPVTVADDGYLVMKSDWLWPADGQDLFDRWASGEVISYLPPGEAPTSLPVIPPSAGMERLLIPALLMYILN